jgi:hypothetical protein
VQHAFDVRPVRTGLHGCSPEARRQLRYGRFDKVLAFAFFAETIIFQGNHRGDREAVIDLGEVHFPGVSPAIWYASLEDFLPPRFVKLGASIRLKCG